MNTIPNKTKAGFMALLLCLAFAFFSLKLFNPPQAVPATAPKEVFSAERAMQQLQVIAKEPHSLGTIANDKVIAYLIGELEQLGLLVDSKEQITQRQ